MKLRDVLASPRGWLQDQQTAATVRGLHRAQIRWEAERAALEAEAALAEARLHAHTRLMTAACQAVEATAEAQVRRQIYGLPLPEALDALQVHLGRERALGEWEQLRGHRSVLGSPVPPPATEVPSLQVHYSDGDIELLALRAVTRFGMLSPAHQATAWAGWEAEARSRLPPNIAHEVIGRAAQLRGVAGR